MRDRSVVLVAVLPALLAFPAPAAPAAEEVSVDPGHAPQSSREWFEDAKFGLFIHWGVYSLLGRGEWVMHNEKIPVSEYEKLPPRFNPTEFDPAEWVSLAKRAGQRYITITSKHHDGFCMWGTEQTKYNIVDGTPYGRDVLKMLSAECRKQGIKLFFYHSHLDWHHPDYYPRGKTGKASGRPESGDWSRYMDYLNRQIAELCSSSYGTAGIWFDGWWDRPDADWQLARTYSVIHRLRPDAMIGNNHHVAPFPGEDFQMFEQDLPGRNTAGFNKARASDLPLETCRTMNSSWGYNRKDKAYRPIAQQIRYLVEAVGLGANLLLNVGPMPNGKFPPEAVEILEGMGRWLDANGAAIYGTRPGPWSPSKLGCAVYKGRRAYFHLLEWPPDGELSLPAFEGVTGVYLLDGRPVDYESRRGKLRIRLTEAARDPVDTILVIDANRPLEDVKLVVPPPPVKAAGERTVLDATKAEATGGIQFEGPPKNALGFWTDGNDTVTWYVETDEAGEFDVSITFACDPASAGTEFEVVCGNSKVGGKILETGSWEKFVTLPLGLLSLPKGASEITVRPTRKPGSAVMNLRELVLERGFVSLFDGRSLKGWWKSVSGYRAEDGILSCIPSKGGKLFTEKEYSDFVFRFEFRLDRGSNNGLGIRAPENSRDAAYDGMEIQILDDGAPVYRNIAPWQHHGSIYHVVAAKPGHLRPVGEWNAEEVVADGRRIAVKLNGVTIVDANLDDVKDPKILKMHPGLKRTKGYIGFLGHGSRVDFRDIRLKEISGK